MLSADMILINGNVYSVKENNELVTGNALAVRAGKIIGIGSNQEITNYADSKTKIIDCKGNTILPGLCDAHCHPSIAASVHAGCDLFGIYIQENEQADDIIDKYMARLKTFIEKNDDNELIRGTGWVLGNFMGNRLPTRHDIDKICNDRPVILESFCQHNLWVNTKALEAAGINENTPDVFAGEIVREANGYPSGVFKEPEAMELIKTRVPGYDFSVEKYKEAFLFYQKEFANKYGVTMVQDCMHSDNARTAFTELAREGRLTCRLRGVYMLEPRDFKNQLSKYIERKGIDNVNDDFRIDTIKIFTEGLFVLNEPFEAEFIQENKLPENFCGVPFWKDEDLIYASETAMQAGFNIHVHAMGDRSVNQSARCLAKAQKNLRESNSQSTDFRNIIAHLMLVDDESYKLMSEANIIANCQPRWMVYDSDIDGMMPMVGRSRAEKAYPHRQFHDNGIRVAFGTDFPVTPPPDTMHELQCAMTRSVFPDAPDYKKFKDKTLGNESPSSLSEAIKSLSLNGAYQMLMENIAGSIEEGKSADFVILDSNLEDVPIDKIYNVKVKTTIFKGKIVYEA